MLVLRPIGGTVQHGLYAVVLSPNTDCMTEVSPLLSEIPAGDG